MPDFFWTPNFKLVFFKFKRLKEWIFIIQNVLEDWMRRPLFDLRQIKERADVVEGLYKNHKVRTDLYTNLLLQVPDIDFISRRFIHKKADLQV